MNRHPPCPPLSLRYFGHATFSLNLDGATLLTDPLLTQRVAFLRRHSPPVKPAWYRPATALLLSHGHLDHCHLPSLKLLDRNLPCLVAPGLKAKLTAIGFNRVIELSVGHSHRLGRLLISAVPAHHRARFFPGLKPVSDCIGFIIRGSHSIYFPGDTDLQLQLARLKSAHLDLCLLPIWGWAIDDHGQHLNPLKAAQALKLIQPKVAIPYHWGTFLPLVFKPFFSKYLIRPVDLFATATKKLAPGVQIIIVPPGKKIDITGKFS